MRAYAKSLGIHVGSLSALLSGKRPLTPKNATKLFKKIGISPAEQDAILKSLPKKENQISLITSTDLKLSRVELEQETYRVISDWYHYGILQIIKTESYKKLQAPNQTKWIARQLKISEIEAGLAIERLVQLNLVEKDLKGYLNRTKTSLTTANKEVTSAALIKGQKQIRERAIYSLENDPIEVRSMTSMTMAIDPNKMNEAKAIIDEFQERISQFLENGKKEKVYQLEVSLYPLQEMEKLK